MSSHLKDSNQFWGAYRSISTSFSRVPPTLTNGKTTVTTTLEKTTMLNSHFSSFFNNSSSQITTPPEPEQDIPILSTIQCSDEEVLQIIGGLRTKIACGPDNITSTMLKRCAGSIAEPLSDQSLSTGEIPTEWKKSNVVPIFKKGDPSEVGNYRPISLLSLISKILERIVHNSLHYNK